MKKRRPWRVEERRQVFGQWGVWWALNTYATEEAAIKSAEKMTAYAQRHGRNIQYRVINREEASAA